MRTSHPYNGGAPPYPSSPKNTGGRPVDNHPYEVEEDDDPFLRRVRHLIPAEVRMISGCHSTETSVDLASVASVGLPHPAGRSGGACTSALLRVFYDCAAGSDTISFQDLLLKLRASLRDSGHTQVPQLTSSRPLRDDPPTPFGFPASGTRRALLVGINYVGQNGELRGCHNDVRNVRRYLYERQGFSPQNVEVLLDGIDEEDVYGSSYGRSGFGSNRGATGRGRGGYPTRQKILASLRSIVQKSQPGDSVYFHYSGHGGLLHPDDNAYKRNVRDSSFDGSEGKQYEETLYPVDHERAGQIRDISLFHHFVQPMAAGVTVTCVMDCCHSGGVLDLPYSYRPTEGDVMSRNLLMSQEDFGALSNLAYLHLLLGGVLDPFMFGEVSSHLTDVLGLNHVDQLESVQGTGLSAIEDTDYYQDELNEYENEDDNNNDSDGYLDQYDDNDNEVDDCDGPVVVDGTPVFVDNNDLEYDNVDYGDSDYQNTNPLPMVVPGVVMPVQETNGFDEGGASYFSAAPFEQTERNFAYDAEAEADSNREGLPIDTCDFFGDFQGIFHSILGCIGGGDEGNGEYGYEAFDGGGYEPDY